MPRSIYHLPNYEKIKQLGVNTNASPAGDDLAVWKAQTKLE